MASIEESKTVVFGPDLWRQGTRGVAGSFSGRPYISNMRLYADGSLGPRPRWKRYGQEVSGGATTYGDSVTDTIFPTPCYTVAALDQDGFLVVNSTDVDFVWSTTSHNSTNAGADPTDTNGPHSWVSRVNEYEWIVNLLWINLVNPTLGTFNTFSIRTDLEATFTLGAGANTFVFCGGALHNGRYFIWGYDVTTNGVRSYTNRIWYSDQYDYDTFTSADQFFDIDGEVSGAASLGPNLLIWNNTGEWYILQGGRDDPANGTLTPLGPNRIPAACRPVARYDGVLLFEGSDQQSMVVVSPTGDHDDVSLLHLGFIEDLIQFDYPTPPGYPAASSINNVAFVPYISALTPHGYHQARGVWTEETWGLDTEDNHQLSMEERLGFECLAVLDDTGPDWKIFTRQMYVDGPEEDDGADPFAEVQNGAVHMPRLWEPDMEVRVTRVIVSGRYWKGDDHSALAMTCSIDDGAGSTHSTTASETFSSYSDATGGGPYRVVFKPNGDGMPFTRYSEVKLTGIVSFSVEEVTVEYEVSQQELL